MAYWIRHKFVTAKGDGTNTTLVKPSNWNEDHDIWMDEGTVIGRPPGSGPGPGQEIPISALFPAGMVTPYAGSTAPAGWLLCAGQSLLRADYPNLFAAIGGTYGAVDATHFSLPDMRGRTAVGVDPGTGRIGAYVAGALGSSGGQESEQQYCDVTVGGTMYGYTQGSISVNVAMNTHNESSGVGGLQFGGSGYAAQTHYHYMDGWFNTQGALRTYVNEGNMTGGGWTRLASNMQPSLVLNYIIKVS